MIHGCELTTDKLSIAQGRQVIVLGAGKSAIDASVAAAEVAISVTNVFRRVCMQYAAYCMHANLAGPCMLTGGIMCTRCPCAAISQLVNHVAGIPGAVLIEPL